MQICSNIFINNSHILQIKCLFQPQTCSLKERWYTGIKRGDTQHKNGPCLYTVMAIWRHSVTTQKCRTSALHWKPHLFGFAFFANIASDHLEAAYILSGYNEGQLVLHGVLSWISCNIYSYERFMKVHADNEWQAYNLRSIILNWYQIPHLHILYLWNYIAATCWEIAAVM